jgi:hypothetical protein
MIQLKSHRQQQQTFFSPLLLVPQRHFFLSSTASPNWLCIARLTQAVFVCSHTANICQQQVIASGLVLNSIITCAALLVSIC